MPRTKGDDRALLELAARLTDRDRLILELLAEHRVLTTGQLADATFGSVRRSEARLAQLHDLGLLDRFRPRAVSGSAPYHWILATLGAAVVAANRGSDVADLGWRADRALAVARSQHLAHLVGVNGVFTALLRAARTNPRYALPEWWSERRCAAEWGELVRPDGYGLWIDDTARVPFLLEYDTGSEPLGRLAAKLPGYADLATATGRPSWLLFVFPTSRREADSRRALAGSAVPVATGAQGATAQHWDPAGPTWLPLPGDRRLRLAELPALR